MDLWFRPSRMPPPASQAASPAPELFAAARRHLENTPPVALTQAGASTPASAAPPPGPRRIGQARLR